MATEAELEARMETLAETRDYARSALHHSYEEVVQGCTQALSLYGFWCVPSLSCGLRAGWLSLLRRSVIDHAIPPEDVEAVQAECIEATGQIQEMRRAAIAARKVGDMRFGDGGEVPRNELLFLPKYAHALGGAHVTAVARAALDSHVRIAQLHVRHVPPNQEDTGEPSNSDIMASGRSKRGWHTCAPTPFRPALPPRLAA